MFEQAFLPMGRPTTLDVLSYMRQLMESTLSLTKAQVEVMKAVNEELSHEYQDKFQSFDPSAIMKDWPSLMTATLRANTEAGALLMKNLKEFQTDMLQATESQWPKFSNDFHQGLIQMMSKLPGEVLKKPAKTNGGASTQAVRSKKAA